MCDNRPPVTAATALCCAGLTGTAQYPALGKCDAGYFPARDYSCGPPMGTGDGGYSCTCRVQDLAINDAGVRDERCVPLCGPSRTCDAGTCVSVPAFWGNDTQTRVIQLCL